MKSKEFFDLVSRMRTVQKEYFKTRDKMILGESKALEFMVDREIERVNNLMEADNE